METLKELQEKIKDLNEQILQLCDKKEDCFDEIKGYCRFYGRRIVCCPIIGPFIHALCSFFVYSLAAVQLANIFGSTAPMPGVLSNYYDDGWKKVVLVLAAAIFIPDNTYQRVNKLRKKCQEFEEIDKELRPKILERDALLDKVKDIEKETEAQAAQSTTELQNATNIMRAEEMGTLERATSERRTGRANGNSADPNSNGLLIS